MGDKKTKIQNDPSDWLEHRIQVKNPGLDFLRSSARRDNTEILKALADDLMKRENELSLTGLHQMKNVTKLLEINPAMALGKDATLGFLSAVQKANEAAASGATPGEQILTVGKELRSTVTKATWGKIKSIGGAGIGLFNRNRNERKPKIEDLSAVPGMGKIITLKKQADAITPIFKLLNNQIDLAGTGKYPQLKNMSETERKEAAKFLFFHLQGKQGRDSDKKYAAGIHVADLAKKNANKFKVLTKSALESYIRSAINSEVTSAVKAMNANWVGKQGGLASPITDEAKNVFAEAFFLLYIGQRNSVDIDEQKLYEKSFATDLTDPAKKKLASKITFKILYGFNRAKPYARHFRELFENGLSKDEARGLREVFQRYFSNNNYYNLNSSQSSSPQSILQRDYGSSTQIVSTLPDDSVVVTNIEPDTTGHDYQKGETFFKVQLKNESNETLQELNFSEYFGDICSSGGCENCSQRELMMDEHGTSGKFHSEFQKNGDLHVYFYIPGENGKNEQRGFTWPKSELNYGKDVVTKIKLKINKNQTTPNIT